MTSPTERTPVTFETSSLDEAVAILGETYAHTELHDRQQPVGTLMRISQHTLTEDVRLDDLEFGLGFTAEVDPLESLVFTELRSGRTSFTSGRETRTYSAGRSYLVAQPEQTYIATVEDITMSMVVIRPSLLDDVADPASHGGGRSVQFVGHEPVSERAARRWRRTCAYVRDIAVDEPDLPDEPGAGLVAAQAARLLAAVSLSTFPNTALTEALGQDRRDAHSDTLRRAIGYIEDNAATDVSIADVAGAASVSIRAVQLAFRRHLDTTPMAYLRQVRLEHARVDLAAAQDEGLTVTAVASRWGFANPGRFATQFRAAYGTTPSEVLRAC